MPFSGELKKDVLFVITVVLFVIFTTGKASPSVLPPSVVITAP